MSPRSEAGVGYGTNLANARPVDLPTEARTEDVEAWRAKMEARRGETAQRARLERAAIASQVAAATYREEPSLPSDLDVPAAPPRTAPAPAAEPAPSRPRGRASQMASTEVAAAATAYLGGQTVPEIAAATGRMPKTIRGALRAAGVTLRDDRKGHSGSNPKRPEDDDSAVVAAVRRLYVDEGLTQAAIGERLGLGTHLVQGIMARHAIPARPPANVTNKGHVGVDGTKSLRARMADAGVTSADVRAWARSHHIPVTTVGIPAAALVDRYIAARAAGTLDDPADDVAPPAVDFPTLDDLIAANPAIGTTIDPTALQAELAAERVHADALAADVQAERPIGELTGAEWLVDRVWTAESWHEAVSVVEGALSGHAASVLAASEPVPDARMCRGCGCTTDRACPGGCWWAEADLCSKCDRGSSDVMAAFLGDVDDDAAAVIAALHDVVTSTEQLLDAQRAYAVARVAQLQRHLERLLTDLAPTTPTGD